MICMVDSPGERMSLILEQSDVASSRDRLEPRDASARDRYLHAALAHIPRLLGAIDRNPFRATYGCLDRQFWHYRTSAFPSEMYQEGALPLALVATTPLPGNRWYGQPRVRELAAAALHYAAKSCHGDGSCDDYYPFERALGAAAFSFAAATETYRLLRLKDADLLAWLRRRGHWLMRHDESGRLANHQALVALGLARLAALTAEEKYAHAAHLRVERVLSWQSSEGWFDEYGGADPGYQTVTIDCLAKYGKLTTHTSPTRKRGSSGDTPVCGASPSLARRASVGGATLEESLRRAVAFARLFLHPDDSYAGPYGSRGTHHFYPHGMELLANDNADAADLADGFLRALDGGCQAYFDDDRLFAHRLGNLIEAYLDWSPERRPSGRADTQPPDGPLTCPREENTWLPQAGLLVRRTPSEHTVISAARGGVFKHFAVGRPPVTDAGLIVELASGRVAVSQHHCMSLSASGRRKPADGPTRDVHYQQRNARVQLSIAGSLHFASFETATPLKQALFHTAMCSVGRFCRTVVRTMLQRRLITGRQEAPLRLTRRFELGEQVGVARPEQGWDGRGSADAASVDEPRPSHPCSGRATLRVIDTIELTSPSVTVQRMSYGTDHEAAYVAAAGVYQESVLEPWTDLGRHVAELNERRKVTIVREW